MLAEEGNGVDAIDLPAPPCPPASAPEEEDTFEEPFPEGLFTAYVKERDAQAATGKAPAKAERQGTKRSRPTSAGPKPGPMDRFFE